MFELSATRLIGESLCASQHMCYSDVAIILLNKQCDVTSDYKQRYNKPEHQHKRNRIAILKRVDSCPQPCLRVLIGVMYEPEGTAREFRREYRGNVGKESNKSPLRSVFFDSF